MLGEAVAAAIAGVALEPGVRDRILARLGGPIGHAARAAIGELAAAPSGGRALRATWAANARAPVPAGIRGVHASWIEALLGELPTAARAAVATGGGGAANVWLARWACATVPPMPAPRGRPVGRSPATLAEIVAWTEPELARWLHDAGADQLAYTANAAGGTLREAMLRRYPAVQRACARIGEAPRLGNLGPVRAAIARCRGALDDLLLLRIGARCVAPHLADEPFARRQIALRFARPIGLVVEAELAAWGAMREHAPTWNALAA